MCNLHFEHAAYPSPDAAAKVTSSFRAHIPMLLCPEPALAQPLRCIHIHHYRMQPQYFPPLAPHIRCTFLVHGTTTSYVVTIGVPKQQQVVTTIEMNSWMCSDCYSSLVGANSSSFSTTVVLWAHAGAASLTDVKVQGLSVPSGNILRCMVVCRRCTTIAAHAINEASCGQPLE